jgi:VWFA-related protein
MSVRGPSSSLPSFALLVAATLALGPAPSAGQNAPATAAAPPSATRPTFATETEVVTVDVLVLDGHDKPVSGLTREEFRVLEDGQPQTLTAFEEVEARLPSEPPASAASSASRVASNTAAPPTRRTFGIVFDDLHLDPLEIEPVRKALRVFLEKETRPGDRLVLLTTSDGRFWTTTRGAEEASFAAALEQVASHRPMQLGNDLRITPFEAMSMLQENRELYGKQNGLSKRGNVSPDTTTTARVTRRRQLARGHVNDRGGEMNPAWETPEEAYAAAVALLERSLAVLRDGIAMLGTQRERKALVLVSEGFILDPSLHGFHEVRDVAARANAVLYFLDARGLPTRPEFFGVDGGSMPPDDVGMTMVDWRQEADGARTLAEETGGLSLQTNDFIGALQRVADESRVTYLLGYEPPNSRRDGRYHELKVEVLRSGLRVRARAGYFAAKGESALGVAAPDAVQRALQDPLDRAEIPLRLASYVLGPAPAKADEGKLEVMVAAELCQGALESRVVDGRRVAEPRVVLSVGRRDRPARIVALDLKIPAPAATSEQAVASKRWRPFATRVVLEPGDTRLRLLVESGGRVGSLTTDVLVPTLDDERLSTPILSDELAGEGRLPLVPIARRSFATADTLHCWVELHGAQAAPEDSRPRTSASFRVRAAGGREWAAGSFDAVPGAQQRTEWLVSVPLNQAPAGESELILSVRDLVSNRSFESRELFSVEHRPDAVAAATQRLGQTGTAAETVDQMLDETLPVTADDGTEPPLATILARAGAYVSRYGESFRNLVADEAYRQAEYWPAGDLSPRRVCNLRSDVVFVPLPGAIPWGTFRDVYSVDGEKVRDRNQRLERLFAKPGSSAYEQAKVILGEGARYNLGEHSDRTINVPTLGLLFLLPENQARLAFTRKGTKTIAGFRTVELAFEEKARPTLVRDRRNADVAATGRFWIDPVSGAVWQTRIEYDIEKSKRTTDRELWATGVVVTEFRREPALDILVPDKMADWYRVGAGRYLEGRASYTNYRHFQVEANWEVTDTKPGTP